MWALVRIRGSFPQDFATGNRRVWTVVVLFLPVIGVIAWYLADWSRRLERNT